MIRLLRRVVLSVLTASLSVACSQTVSYKPEFPHALRPRSILVIPPLNDAVDVNASYTFLATVSRPLAEKGYYVYPVAVIDRFFKENGLPTPAEMNKVSLEKIREHIGADAVLYVRIREWGQKFELLSSRAVVSSDLSLVDTATGEQIWDAKAYAVQSGRNNHSSSLTDAFLGAVVEQIVGSLSDSTYALSRKAAHSAINNLPLGPYYQSDVDI